MMTRSAAFAFESLPNRFTLSQAYFYRDGNDLLINLVGDYIEQILISDHWVSGSKIELFAFADGTYAASYMEYIAANGGSTGICYENGIMVMCNPYGMPVVLDLDGDGLELLAINRSRARFDLDGNGMKERIGWVGAGDGILVLDRNDNGRIDSFREMTFVQDFLGAGSDLEGLLAYDTDRDGFLSATDTSFSEFQIWIDRNGNGKSEKRELFTLEELGIASIGLERSNIRGLDVGADQNQVQATSTFIRADGTRGVVGDVALFADWNEDECGCGSASSSAGDIQPAVEGADLWII